MMIWCTMNLETEEDKHNDVSERLPKLETQITYDEDKMCLEIE